jgi:AAA domain
VSLRLSSVPEEFRKAPKPETVTAADLMSAELPPVRWCVRGVLPEGVTLLAGKPKLGKSWLALGLCVAVAAGGVALGTRQVEQGGVLFLALEDNRRRLQKRLGKMLCGPAPTGLEMATTWPKLDEGGVEALRAWLVEHPEARLVAVDTLAKICPRTRGQNIYQEDYAALEELLPLAAEHEVAIVVVHHTRKMTAADPLDEISGSTGLTGGVDGVLVLKRDRGKADAVLHVDGRDIEEPAEYALKWDAETAGWTIVGDAEEHRTSEIRKAILEVVSNTDEPIGPTDVADALDESVNKIKQRMYQMSKDGELRVVSRGRYVIGSHNLRNLPNLNHEKVTNVMEGMDPHNQNGYHSLSADEGNEWVQRRIDAGMREEDAVKALMNMMQRTETT